MGSDAARLDEMRQRLGVHHLFYLATCQRVVWVLDGPPEDAATALVDAYRGVLRRAVPLPERHDGFDAFHHLCSVASSLDALVPGEPQVLGQVRTAVRKCEEQGLLGPDLRHVFQHVLRTAKEVRSSTSLFRGKVSLLPLAEHVMRAALQGPRPTAAVLGTGELGTQAMRFLRRLVPDVRVCVVSRDEERGRSFSSRHDVDTDVLHRFLAAPAPDLVVCAMEVQAPVLLADRLAAWAQQRPLTVVDLGLPRNTDRPPALERLVLVQLDDLAGQRAASLAHREAAVEDARRILADAVDRVRHEYDLRCHASTLYQLTRRFEEVAESRWREAGIDQEQARKWYDQTVRALLHEAVEVVKRRPVEEA